MKAITKARSELKTIQVPKICDVFCHCIAENASTLAHQGFLVVSTNMIYSDEVVEMIILEMKRREGITCVCTQKAPKKCVLRVSIEPSIC